MNSQGNPTKHEFKEVEKRQMQELVPSLSLPQFFTSIETFIKMMYINYYFFNYAELTELSGGQGLQEMRSSLVDVLWWCGFSPV